MSGLSFLLTWYNIPFLILFGCSLILILLQLLGGFGDDSDADADADADGDDGHLGNLLGFLGVGSVPLTLVVMAFLASMGLIGLLVNTVLANLMGGYPRIAFLPVLLGSMILAVWSTNRISRGLGRLAPESSTAVGFEQLVGRVGTVITPSLSTTYGRVKVRDSFGSIHTVFAVIASGDPIPEDSEVALIAYDPARRHFTVKQMQ